MYPIRPVRGLLIVTLLAAEVAAQDTSSPAAEPSAVKPAPSPAERLVSPKTAELLEASLPKYQPIAEKPALGSPANPESEKPANGIVRLPRLVVSGTKLPTPIELMTKTELEHYTMDHYIGPEDGLDRGFLNLFTIAGLWKKIPVLGSFQFVGSETNEDRALRLYDTAERKRKMAEMVSLMKMTKETAPVPDSEKMKQEINDTVIRHADLGR